MVFSSSIAASNGSTSRSRSCCPHCCPHRSQGSSGAATRGGVAAAGRGRRSACIKAQLQQHHQSLPGLLHPSGQQLLHVSQQQLLWPRQQQLLKAQGLPQLGRCSVVASAAGRRRRQSVAEAPQEEDPDLDMDDVMYAGDGDEDDTDILAADDDAEEFEEFEEDEEEEEDGEAEEGEDEETGQGDEDWAAALDEFDTGLDTQVEQPPSKEEQELAAAKAMVRFDEDFAQEDGTQLIVSEVPPEEPDRPKTFEEQTVALSAQDKQTLEQNMASYTVFPMYELDLLVSSTPDGQLVLSDCFCLDTVEDSFLRPTILEGTPSQPSLYQVIPWEHTSTGDLLKHKDPEVARMKLYFIGLHSATPHEVDMTRIYSFDADTQQMKAHTPKVLGADSQDSMMEPVMRIREDGVYIEDAGSLPGDFFIAEGFAGHPEDKYNNPDKEFDMWEFVKMGLWDKPRSMEELRALETGSGAVATVTAAAAAAPGASAAGEDVGGLNTFEESQLEERLEELELMEELDDMPDVPAIDMM